MINPAPVNATLATYNKIKRFPFGNWLVARAICWRSPYFASIKPKITVLRAGHMEASIKKRRAITNHIGTVHAIAAANLCEFVAGVSMEMNIHPSLRWIPMGMTIEYLAKSKTDLRAVYEAGQVDWAAEQILPLSVQVFDTEGTVVVRAVINMKMSTKKK